jgi:hypothetical protein
LTIRFDRTHRPAGVDSGRRASTARSAPTDARAERLLALQQGAGNRATVQAVARWPFLHPPAQPPNPVSQKPASTPAPAPAAQPPKPGKPPMLAPEVRRYLRMHTRDRMLAALPFFLQALEHNVAAIKAEEKAKAEWAAALVEIFMGIAAPAFARLLVNKAGVTGKLAGEIAGMTKTTKTAKHAVAAKTAAEAAQKAEEYAWEAAKLRAEATAARAALKAKKGGRGAMKAAEATAAKAATKAAELEEEAEVARQAYQMLAPVELISDNELLKETIKGATKATTTALKQNVTVLFGEDDVNVFSNKLGEEFHHAIDDVLGKIARDSAYQPDTEGAALKDAELVGLHTIYDPDNTGIETYRAMLKEKFEAFTTYVRVIEKGAATLSGKHDTWHGTNVRAVWVTAAFFVPRKQLWLLKEKWQAQPGREDPEVHTELMARIPKDMEPFAIAKTEAEFGKGSVTTMAI